jgi:uncharacterized protein YtpQ (UPF0354 family)
VTSQGAAQLGVVRRALRPYGVLMIKSSLHWSMLLVAAVVFMVTCSHPPTNPDLQEKLEFRDHVLSILRTEFPDKQFATTDNPEILKLGDAELGLQNLRAGFLAAGKPTEELRKMVREHFTAVLAAVEPSKAAALDWNSARSQLRLQLLPAEYVDTVPLVYKPFAKQAVQGFVLDGADAYQYVLREDLARWDVTIDDASRVAEANLQTASNEIPVNSSSGSDKFLIIQTSDGYDAARLLLPNIRVFAAQQLGSPFYAGVPNRDFLIMWAKSASPDFQAHARSRIETDFAQEPYPLSPSTFEVTPTTIKELSNEGK